MNLILLIGQDRLAEALEQMQQLAAGEQAHLLTEVILLRGRLAGLESSARMGTLSDEQEILQRNILRNDIISLAGQFKDATATAAAGTQNPAAEAAAGASKILFLGCCPPGTPQLDIDREMREVEQGLKLSKHRDRFDMEVLTAVQTGDIRRALLNHEPRYIHFAGSATDKPIPAPGSSGRQLAPGLIVEDAKGGYITLQGTELARLFAMFPGTEGIVLNACFTDQLAEDISQTLPWAIGMKDIITDDSAIIFAVAFWDGMAYGKGVQFAFDMGVSAIRMESNFTKDADAPVLFFKKT